MPLSDKMRYEQKIAEAKNVAQIFTIVKELVTEYLGIEQAGLLVGMSDLGMLRQGFVGAFYSPDANTIIINKRPLAKMLSQTPDQYNNYLFHVVLHEYVHSLGLYDEAQTRQLVEQMTVHYFGESHPITQLTWNIGRELKHYTDEMPKDINIEFVEGIDRKNTDYIN